MEIVFSVPHLFTTRSSLAENACALEASLEYLIALDIDFLRRHPSPDLYHDDVFYKTTVEWEPIPAVQLRGHGDCKSLVAWRIAELRIRGIPCRPVFRYWTRPDGRFDYHILVMRNGAVFEDPSKVHGMKAYESGPAPMRRPLFDVLTGRR